MADNWQIRRGEGGGTPSQGGRAFGDRVFNSSTCFLLQKTNLATLSRYNNHYYKEFQPIKRLKRLINVLASCKIFLSLVKRFQPLWRVFFSLFKV